MSHTHEERVMAALTTAGLEGAPIDHAGRVMHGRTVEDRAEALFDMLAYLGVVKVGAR